MPRDAVASQQPPIADTPDRAPEVYSLSSRSDLRSYRTVLVAVDDGVATITLNRPRRRNAFGDGMGEELVDACLKCDRDENTA